MTHAAAGGLTRGMGGQRGAGGGYGCAGGRAGIDGTRWGAAAGDGGAGSALCGDPTYGGGSVLVSAERVALDALYPSHARGQRVARRQAGVGGLGCGQR
jgi:hypothetical protein